MRWRLGRSMDAFRTRYTRCCANPTDRIRAYIAAVVVGQFGSAETACAAAIPATRHHASRSIGRRKSGTLVTYERPPDRSRISRVRAWSIAILVLLAALSAAADVIRLKNGRTIWADEVRQNKDRVEYDVGEDTYAIPKSSVDRIDA